MAVVHPARKISNDQDCERQSLPTYMSDTDICVQQYNQSALFRAVTCMHNMIATRQYLCLWRNGDMRLEPTDNGEL